MTPDDRLRDALAEWRLRPTAHARAELLAALVDAPVLAAVAATSTGERVVPETGRVAESGAELAVLLIAGPDGARALPVFPDVDALRHWRLDARPVALTGAQACSAALDEGAVHLVVDPAGAAAVLDLDELTALAAGWVPVPGSSLSTRRSADAVAGLSAPTSAVPDGLLAALAQALRPEGLTSARLLSGPDGLVLGVCGPEPLAAPSLAGLAQRIVQRLGDALPAGGLGLVEVAPSGVGLPVISTSRGRRWGRRGDRHNG